MSSKNLENAYCSRINDIGAGRVKELLIQRGFLDPTLSANQIGKAIISLTTAAITSNECQDNPDEIHFSISILEGVFDFFTDLMNEPLKPTCHVS